MKNKYELWKSSHSGIVHGSPASHKGLWLEGFEEVWSMVRSRSLVCNCILILASDSDQKPSGSLRIVTDRASDRVVKAIKEREAQFLVK